MSDRARCPKCRNSNELSLIETHDETGATEFGVIRYDERGALVPPGDFWFEAGNPTAVRIQCGQCEHVWTPRGRLVSSARAEEL